MRGVLTLCGSTKFEHLFREAAAELTVADWAVLTVGVFDRVRLHNFEDPASVKLKAQLDALHLAKIDASQAVVVLNGDGAPFGLERGYIGPSTQGEVKHARKGLKAVYWWDLKGAMLKLVETDRPVRVRQPWDWNGGDQPWTNLLTEGQVQRLEGAATFAGELESEFDR